MIPLWTWYIQYTPGTEIDVARTEASNLLELSQIDTQVVSMYVSDRDVALIRRTNRDTGAEFVLLDRREGGLYSQWLGSVLGSPPETATVATVDGPVSSGVVPVVGAPVQVSQTNETPPIVVAAPPAAAPDPPSAMWSIAIAAIAAVGVAYVVFK